ncbi:MAG TPA: hypothetical protein VFX38_07255 [Gammaproteobacteria bacterium]|nr:hypothetical protein [Gammaproteobacteria bacterium]
MNKSGNIFAVMAGGALAAGLALSPAFALGSNTDNLQGARAKQSQKYEDLTQAKVQKVIATYKKDTGALENYFNDAYGYVVFPSIGVGSNVVGNDHGTGAVYRDGVLVGHSTVVKLPMNVETGGQTFSEMIFFQDKRAFELFTEDKYHFHGKTTAADVRGGLTPSTQYSHGMAVFINMKSGAETTAQNDKIKIGAQEFMFDPIGAEQNPSATHP